jgi:hypothetical protein
MTALVDPGTIADPGKWELFEAPSYCLTLVLHLRLQACVRQLERDGTVGLDRDGIASIGAGSATNFLPVHRACSRASPFGAHAAKT